jgi:hypothetical protein
LQVEKLAHGFAAVYIERLRVKLIGCLLINFGKIILERVLTATERRRGGGRFRLAQCLMTRNYSEQTSRD